MKNEFLILSHLERPECQPSNQKSCINHQRNQSVFENLGNASKKLKGSKQDIKNKELPVESVVVPRSLDQETKCEQSAQESH